MQASLNVRFAILAGGLLLFLAGCTPPTQTKPEAPYTAEEAAAMALSDSGEHADAAQRLAELAERFPQQRDRYLFAAAQQWLAASKPTELGAVLDRLAAAPLTPPDKQRLALLRGEQQLLQGDPLAALDAIGLQAPSDTQAAMAYHDIAARAYRLSGNMLESAAELVALDGLQTDLDQRLATQREILNTLALLSEAALQQLRPTPPGVMGGWMDLALALKRHGQEPQTLDRAVRGWQVAHQGHPALPGLLDGMVTRLQDQYHKAAHVAVLLPQSGPYAGAATAIRDGIMISWYQQPAAERPELRFYDATDPTQVWPLLGEAVANGAEAVIGPLDKDSVAQLARAGELPVPVLALNQVPLETQPPANFYQFSLSPEDEARQVAERAWLDNHRYPLVLVPDNEWGSRVAAAFRARWQSLGGRVAGEARYDDRASDYGDILRPLLHLDASQARNRQLERLFGRSLEFEPRRRADADAVFLAARNRQARLMRPQLQFHHAAHLPVYTTSHIWDGSLDRNEALDLTGIMLPDMPWIVDTDQADPLSRDSLAKDFPAIQSAYGRLYAMGMDSLRLLPHLARLASASWETLDGRTGQLYMDALHQVHRQLVWTRLGTENNKVLGYTPRLDLPGAELPDSVTP